MKNAFCLFIISVLLLIVFLPSYTKMQDLREKNKEYDHQLKVLQQERDNLAEEKRRLKEDPEYLEKVAREKMGLIKDGEIIYKITPVSDEE